MTITLNLTVFGWKLGTFDIRLDLDEAAVGVAPPIIDRGVKRMSRFWTRHMI